MKTRTHFLHAAGKMLGVFNNNPAQTCLENNWIHFCHTCLALTEMPCPAQLCQKQATMLKQVYITLSFIIYFQCIMDFCINTCRLIYFNFLFQFLLVTPSLANKPSLLSKTCLSSINYQYSSVWRIFSTRQKRMTCLRTLPLRFHVKKLPLNRLYPHPHP